jgi:hypothetical protein
MPEIGDGLLSRGNGKTLRHRAKPKSGKLARLDRRALVFRCLPALVALQCIGEIDI